MPKLTQTVPRICKHKGSGQAVVYLSGQTIYLGEYGSRIAKEQYDRVVAEWLACGRTLPEHQDAVTVAEICLGYLRWSKTYYTKNGQQTSEVGLIKRAISILKPIYANAEAAEFGPLALDCVRERMIAEGWCRENVNGAVARIRRMFRWAASKELVPGSVHENLKQVTGLRKGKTSAFDHPAVEPVQDAVIDATLPHLPTVVADMVRVQRLLGCRPGELCIMRPMDLDRQNDVWRFVPATHKTEHRDKARTIYVGPLAQTILNPYLSRPGQAYCFSPAESMAQLRAEKQRKTPLSQGDRQGYSARTRRRRKPKRQPADHYSTASYRRAVHRACSKHGIEKWSPNQLRHTRATEVRRDHGLEAASATLGHSSLAVTQVYAERNQQLAIEAAQRTG